MVACALRCPAECVGLPCQGQAGGLLRASLRSPTASVATHVKAVQLAEHPLSWLGLRALSVTFLPTFAQRVPSHIILQTLIGMRSCNLHACMTLLVSVTIVYLTPKSGALRQRYCWMGRVLTAAGSYASQSSSRESCRISELNQYSLVLLPGNAVSQCSMTATG